MKRCLLFLCAAFLALSPSARGADREDSLIAAALDPSAEAAAREDACRRLATAGTDRAAVALAPLLADTGLAHVARLAIQSIPGPAASDALLGALAKAPDASRRIGLVNSLAVRREPRAVPALTGLLAAEDPATRAAAAQALGAIGGDAALAALASLPPEAVDASLRAEAVLRCAEGLAGSDPARAADICRRMLKIAPSPQKAVALCVLITAAGGGEGDLVTALRSDDRWLRDAALGLIVEGAPEEVVSTVAKRLGGLNPTVQAQALAVLRARACRAGAGVARPLLSSTSDAVRVAAINLLGELGSDDDADLLLALAADASPVGDAARTALAVLPGPGADKRLLSILARGDAAARVRAIALLADRGHSHLLDRLCEPGVVADADTARAAAQAFRALGRGADFPRALALAARLPTESRSAFQPALGVLAKRMENPGLAAREVGRAMEDAAPENRPALMSLYTAAQGPAGVEALAQHARDTNRVLRKEAIRALGSWENAAAVAPLLEIAEKDADADARLLAIRSAMSVLRRPRAVGNPDEGVALIRRALAIAERPEDRTALVASLPSFKGPAAKTLAEQLRGDAALGAAAEDALSRMK